MIRPIRRSRPRLAFHVDLLGKLMLWLTVLLALVVGISTYLLIEHDRARRLSELEDRATRIADLYSSSLALPLWNVDREAIHRQLAALAPNPQVVEFTVTAAHYGVVSSVKRPEVPDPRDTIVRVRPIEYGPPGGASRETIGTIRVVMTKWVAERDIRHAQRAMFAVMAVTLIVLYVAMFVLLKRAVRDPMRRLEETVDRIAAGDLDARCPVDSTDEVGRFAGHVNAMAEEVRESTQRLRMQRDHLKAEVAERERTEAALRASRESLRELAAHMEFIREEERRHMAMAVHDELGQLLTALKMDVSLLKLKVAPGSPERQKADEMGELIERTMPIVRNVANHLRPAALNFGLVSALEWLADDFSRHGTVSCGLQVQGSEPTLSDTRATAVFRIAQEALTNVARHADASHVEIVLDTTGEFIALTVEDDGRGFDVDAARSGYSYGLQGMAERARLADAQLEVRSTPASGSLVRVLFRAEVAS